MNLLRGADFVRWEFMPIAMPRLKPILVGGFVAQIGQ